MRLVNLQSITNKKPLPKLAHKRVSRPSFFV
jgi:hypothetical protein